MRLRFAKSVHEQLTKRFQFSPAFCRGRRVGRLKLPKPVQDNLRNDQPGVLLVVGRHDVPRRVAGAGCAQALLIRLHVLLPVFPFLNIGEAEFPVLFRFINARQEALSLFLLGKMEEDFHRARSIAIEMTLQVDDGAISFLPKGFLIPAILPQIPGRAEAPGALALPELPRNRND